MGNACPGIGEPSTDLLSRSPPKPFMVALTSLLAQRERIKSVCLLPYRLPRDAGNIVEGETGSAHACSRLSKLRTHTA
jgi:hypothetical protein